MISFNQHQPPTTNIKNEKGDISQVESMDGELGVVKGIPIPKKYKWRESAREKAIDECFVFGAIVVFLIVILFQTPILEYMKDNFEFFLRKRINSSLTPQNVFIVECIYTTILILLLPGCTAGPFLMFKATDKGANPDRALRMGKFWIAANIVEFAVLPIYLSCCFHLYFIPIYYFTLGFYRATTDRQWTRINYLCELELDMRSANTV